MLSRRSVLSGLLALPLVGVSTVAGASEHPRVIRTQITTWRRKQVNGDISDKTIYTPDECRDKDTIFYGFREVWERPRSDAPPRESRLLTRVQIRVPHVVSWKATAEEMEETEALFDRYENVKATDPMRIVVQPWDWTFIVLDPFY